MFVGPFFYIEEAIKGTEGLYADLLNVNNAEQIADKLGSPISHETLFDRLESDVEYMEIPRGRVIYDASKKEAVIYIDRCIETRTEEIRKLFNIDNFRIEHDEHYVCPRCWNLIQMWE